MASVEDPAPAETSAAPGEPFRIRSTTYVYLFLLLLAYVLPAVIHLGARRVTARQESSLSAAAFENFVEAETNVRRAFGMDVVRDLGGPSTGGMLDLSRQRNDALAEATKQYRKLLSPTAPPGVARRILILDHARHLPFNDTLVARSLVPALRNADRSAAQIAEEQTLWRALYGQKRVDPARADAYAAQIRAMRLRFLESAALRDLYTAAGQPARARPFEARLRAGAERFLVGAFGFGVFFLVGFLAGLAFLGMFVVTALDKRWPRVARVATQPQRLGWGDLLDAFVFYLLLVRGIGLVVGSVAARLIASPTPHVELAFGAALQAITGIGAGAYLWSRARARGYTLADIGLTTRETLVANIGYGVAGYFAALPLVLVLRLLSQAIFRHVPNTSPNPILPLLVSERDIAWRFVIFVMVAVAAPFFEELFFRGALFSALRTRWNWVASAAISGALFAIVHPPQDWLPIFGLGFGLATMREMRQSLVPSMTAHFIQNTITFVTLSSLFGGG